MTLRDYFTVLRKRWITVAVCALLGMLLALGITAVTPSTYTAKATNFVSITGSAADAGSQYQNSQYALGIVQSFTTLAESPDLLKAVIDDLGLDMTPRALAKEITVTNPTNTVNLVVTANSHSAAEAADIANEVSKQLGLMISTLASSKSSPVEVSLPVKAIPPLSPSSPRPKLNLALGLLVGLAVGAGIAVLRNQLDTTIKSNADLTALTGAAPLGSVRFDSGLSNQPLVTLDPSRPGVEDFRSIRTSLRFVDVDHSPQLIVVSSAIAHEGKSVTSCNLAIILAQAGHKVCLVEGDLRLPKATAYLGVDGSVGLSDVVAGHLSLDEALITWGTPSVTVLAAGTTPPDPNNLLGTEATKRLFEDLRERFDMIIVDAPPLLPVSDAAILSSFSDGVILVARHGHVHADQFLHALDMLNSSGGRMLGTVLTHVPLKHHRGRAGYGYGATYGPTASADADLTASLDEPSLHAGIDVNDDAPDSAADEVPPAASESATTEGTSHTGPDETPDESPDEAPGLPEGASLVATPGGGIDRPVPIKPHPGKRGRGRR